MTKGRGRPNAAASPINLPDELMTEVLSFLTVKSLMRMRCLNKSCNTLISDPTFIKMHLKRSARNANLSLISIDPKHFVYRSVVSFSVRCLIDNPSITLTEDPYYRLNDKDCHWVVGSCNGLLCLCGYSSFIDCCIDIWFCFWNPATRKITNKLGYLRHYVRNSPYKFSFGYDNSTDTYKVVAYRRWRRKVDVFSLGDNVWRNIQSFPVFPIFDKNGVHLSGTLNWLAIRDRFNYCPNGIITIGQFVIISLDLATETYRQLIRPGGLDEVLLAADPTLSVLMDCLCISYDLEDMYFVIWQMTEFGVEESWTQFLKISYQILGIDFNFRRFMGNDFEWLPLHLLENGYTLVLANNRDKQAILYNWRDNSVEETEITKEIWWFYANDYVESLVSPC